MVIKIVPKNSSDLVAVGVEKGSQATIYNSNQSLSSSSGGGEKEPRVLFLGFAEVWERDLWSSWLAEVSIRIYLMRSKLR